MNLVFDLKVEVDAKSSSSYTLEHIEKRLETLQGIDTDEAREEIKFLEDLKTRKADQLN